MKNKEALKLTDKKVFLLFKVKAGFQYFLARATF
jgi:hypothetical protein